MQLPEASGVHESMYCWIESFMSGFGIVYVMFMFDISRIPVLAFTCIFIGTLQRPFVSGVHKFMYSCIPVVLSIVCVPLASVSSPLHIQSKVPSFLISIFGLSICLNPYLYTYRSSVPVELLSEIQMWLPS